MGPIGTHWDPLGPTGTHWDPLGPFQTLKSPGDCQILSEPVWFLLISSKLSLFIFKIVLGTHWSPGPTWDPWVPCGTQWVPHGTHFGTHLILTAFWFYINICKKNSVLDWLGFVGTHWDLLGPIGTHWYPFKPLKAHRTVRSCRNLFDSCTFQVNYHFSGLK